MLFTTLAVVTTACLLMPFTRMYGVIGALITLYFFPYHTLTFLGVILLGGVAHLYFNHRRKRHAI